MAPANSPLEVAWRSLATQGDSRDGWRTIPVSPTGATIVLAGRRYPGGTETLLVRFSAASLPTIPKWPEGSGFLLEVTPEEGGTVYVALTRRDTGNLDLFTLVASDIAHALADCPMSDEPKSLATMIGRVRAWQEFMRKGGSPLSPEAEIGLFGELSLLIDLLDAGVDSVAACEAWYGPLGGLRDFELGTGGIEVKSTSSSTGFRARIDSLDQLDDTDRQPLFLAALRMRQTQHGRLLSDLVEATRDVVAGDPLAERLLEERLIASGFRDTHGSSYIRRFEITEARLLLVGPGFPRLTPNSVPVGVERASYQIDIEQVASETYDVSGALIKLKGC